MRPTALRADVYAGTERPVGINRETVMHVTSFPPFASNDVLLNRRSSVAATRNRVKNISEIRFSLRRRGEQRAQPRQISAPPLTMRAELSSESFRFGFPLAPLRALTGLVAMLVIAVHDAS